MFWSKQPCDWLVRLRGGATAASLSASFLSFPPPIKCYIMRSCDYSEAYYLCTSTHYRVSTAQYASAALGCRHTHTQREVCSCWFPRIPLETQWGLSTKWCVPPPPNPNLHLLRGMSQTRASRHTLREHRCRETHTHTDSWTGSACYPEHPSRDQDTHRYRTRHTHEPFSSACGSPCLCVRDGFICTGRWCFKWNVVEWSP